MEGFRRSYEYEEERGIGGLLMVFSVMLLSVEVLLAAAILVQGYAVLKAVPYFGPVFLVLGIGYLLLIPVTCIALRRTSRHAVALSKALLIARVLVLTPAYVRLFATFSANPRVTSGFLSRGNFVVVALVVPLAYLLLFSVLWYSYLSTSKRVRQLMETASAKRGERSNGGEAAIGNRT